MTDIEKRIEEEVDGWFPAPLNRKMDRDIFRCGIKVGISLERERSKRLVEALEIIAIPYTPNQGSPLQTIKIDETLARKALDEYRAGEKASDYESGV